MAGVVGEADDEDETRSWQVTGKAEGATREGGAFEGREPVKQGPPYMFRRYCPPTS